MTESDVSYDAEQAGAKIGKSGDWMKKQARAGKIPASKVGRSFRWTPAHIVAILKAGEQRPATQLVPRTPARRRAQPAATTPTLKANTPPRRRSIA